MADTKHTPGPWVALGVTVTSSPSNASPTGYALAHVLNPYAGAKGSADRVEANARLLAASPEMLAVLKTTLGNIMSLGPAGALESVPMPFRVWAQVVSDVIAKAEGGAA